MARIQIVLSDNVAKKFRTELAKHGFKKGDISSEIEKLIKQNISKIKSDVPLFKQRNIQEIDDITKNEIETFYKKIKTLEKDINRGLLILLDKKSRAFYTECHILSEELIEKADIDAAVDPDSQEEFRLNRRIIESHPAFKEMIIDAINGRQFSDIVVDFNQTYKGKIPLKILGGQHRIDAIRRAFEKKEVNVYHGIRIYFNLNVSNRVEIADIANTNINVSLDLRDRLKEQELQPPGRLRKWCWEVGILEEKKDFAEKRRSNQKDPTVRMMRTFIVNFYEGKGCKKNIVEEAVEPYLPMSGGMDEKYYKIFNKINKSSSFSKQKGLTRAMKNFIKLYKKQVDTAPKEYKYRALGLAFISAWAFVAGALQKKPDELKKLYSLPDKSGDKDPLNSDAIGKARHEKDPPTYRGVGIRFNEKERGRLVQLFYRYAHSEKKKLTLAMYISAIRLYHFNKDKERVKKQESAF